MERLRGQNSIAQKEKLNTTLIKGKKHTFKIVLSHCAFQKPGHFCSWHNFYGDTLVAAESTKRWVCVSAPSIESG